MTLAGERYEISDEQPAYPASLRQVADPPKKLYVIGNPAALCEGLAVVGARKATPYGIGCARRFAAAAANKGIVIISGGARGCDAAAHQASLEANTPTVVFLGGGCDELYPAEHAGLFQRIVDAGGAIVSEHPWQQTPRPYMFRLRNRLIAGLAKAVLIVEAGLPSGTFSTADEALAANREVLVVPGSITSATSRGANRLLYQGAIPIVDDEVFDDVLFSLFGCMKQPPQIEVASMVEKGEGEQKKREHPQEQPGKKTSADLARQPVIAALLAQPMAMEELYLLAQSVCQGNVHAALMEWLIEAQHEGLITRYPDGRWGSALR